MINCPHAVDDENGLGIGIDLDNDHTYMTLFNSMEKVINVDTCIAFTKNGYLVDHKAREMLTKNPSSVVNGIVDLIGTKKDDPMFNKYKESGSFKLDADKNGNPKITVEYMQQEMSFSPTELLALLLSYMKSKIQPKLDSKNTPFTLVAVISVPAYFTSAQREEVRNAATMADFKVRRILNKPSAASVNLEGCGLTGQKNVLFFSMDSNSIGIALVSYDYESWTVQVKRVYGKVGLGSQSFDDVLVQHSIQKFHDQHQIEIPTSFTKVFETIRSKIKRPRMMFGRTDSSTVEISNLISGYDLKYTLTKSDYFKLCEHLYTEASALAQNVIENTKIDQLVMIGPETDMAKIYDYIQLKNRSILNTNYVKRDSILAGAARLSSSYQTQLKNSQRQFLIIDVIMRDLKISVGGNPPSIVLPRNKPIPCKGSMTYNQEAYLHARTS